MLPLSVAAVAAVAALAPAPEAGGNWVTLNNGVRMPQVALGVWKYDNATAEDAVVKAYDAGFRHFLTAYLYGNQVGVGNGLKRLFARGVKRDSIFVASMVPACTLPQDNMTGPNCYAWTAKKVAADLELLGVDHLDIVIVHAPDTGPLRGCDAQSCETDLGDYRAMDDARKAGKVRAVGVSNYCQGCIDCLINKGFTPQLNQVQYHYGMGDDPIGLVSYLTARKILLQAYSPLASGQVIGNQQLTTIGAAHNKTAAQVALKWIVDKGFALATKADDPKYLQQDIDLFQWSLKPAETQWISEAPCPSSWPQPYCVPSYACGYTFAPYPQQ